MKYIAASLFTLFSVSGFSQEEQKGNPKDTARVNYKSVFENAEEYLMDANYEKALPLYESLLIQNPKNSSWHFKVGLCYLNSPSEFSKSVQHFEQAVTVFSTNTRDNLYREDKAPVAVFLYLGDAYHRNFRFDDATEAYRKFKTYVSTKDSSTISFVDYKIQVCKNAKELVADPVNLYIKNLGEEINSPYADYSAVLSADESILLFTSRRSESVGQQTDENGKYFEDIYFSYRSDNEMGWQQAKNVGSPINTPGHEATIGTSIDGQILFIYKDDDSGSIYITNMQGENWTIPEKIGGEVNSKYWESHAALSADGNTLFFVSNRPGGLGGRDIYRSKKLPSGGWSKAMNLGASINTPYEEDSPFLQPGSSTLYFSSQGHRTMGGFDIFQSNYVDTGLFGGWTEPQNIGYPVNTTGDDLFYFPTLDKKKAYYSSFAQGGLGDKDIYQLTFLEKEESKLTVLRGSVVNDMGQIPAGVTISIIDANNGDIVGSYAPNSKTGRYLFILPHSRTYKITYSASGYHPVTMTYKVEPGKQYIETEMVFILDDIRLEKKSLGTVGVYGVTSNIQKKIVKNVAINVIDNVTGKPVGTYASDHKGGYQFVLERGKNYNLSFESEGYMIHSENVNLPKENIYSSIEKNVTLQPVAKGSKIILKNLFFDVNKSKIRKESFVELDKISGFLEKNAVVKIEISGHTDNQGDDKMNMKLSDARSKAVMNYFVKKGINKARLTYKGYGEELPIASNETEPERQLNRRVEMKIIDK